MNKQLSRVEPSQALIAIALITGSVSGQSTLSKMKETWAKSWTRTLFSCVKRLERKLISIVLVLVHSGKGHIIFTVQGDDSLPLAE